MDSQELSIYLTGEFTKTTLFVGGIEIQLYERREHQLERKFSRFKTDGLLDVMFHLEGSEGTIWTVKLKIGDRVIWEQDGAIGPYGYCELKEVIKINE